MNSLIRFFKAVARWSAAIERSAELQEQANAVAEKILDHEPLLVQASEPETNGKGRRLTRSGT